LAQTGQRISGTDNLGFRILGLGFKIQREVDSLMRLFVDGVRVSFLKFKIQKFKNC